MLFSVLLLPKWLTDWLLLSLEIVGFCAVLVVWVLVHDWFEKRNLGWLPGLLTITFLLGAIAVRIFG